MIDTFHMARQIEKALLDTVTNIIAVMHWGEEYFTTGKPSRCIGKGTGMGELQGIQIVYGFSYTAMSFVAGMIVIGGQDVDSTCFYLRRRHATRTSDQRGLECRDS